MSHRSHPGLKLAAPSPLYARKSDGGRLIWQKDSPGDRLSSWPRPRARRRRSPGCEPAARKLIPYVVPDENVIPGVPTFYATTCDECPAGCGVVARIREGRVIKLEGNPADPIGQGSIVRAWTGRAARSVQSRPVAASASFAAATASCERCRGTTRQADRWRLKLAAAAKAGKDRVAIIARAEGPDLQKIARGVRRRVQVDRSRYFTRQSTTSRAREAAKTLFGRRDLPVYRIDQAEVLISFGADFLETWHSPVELARQYSVFRTPQNRRGALTIGRAIYVGPRLSMTASKCDEWIATAPGREAMSRGACSTFGRQGWVRPERGLRSRGARKAVGIFRSRGDESRTGVPAETITRLAETLRQSGRRARARGHRRFVFASGGDDPQCGHRQFRAHDAFFEGEPPEIVAKSDESQPRSKSSHQHAGEVERDR